MYLKSLIVPFLNFNNSVEVKIKYFQFPMHPIKKDQTLHCQYIAYILEDNIASTKLIITYVFYFNKIKRNFCIFLFLLDFDDIFCLHQEGLLVILYKEWPYFVKFCRIAFIPVFSSYIKFYLFNTTEGNISRLI